VRPDDIWRQSHQLGGEGLQPRRLPASVPVFELNVVSVDIAEVSQSLHEAVGARPRVVEVFGRAGVEDGDPGRFATRLPYSGARSEYEAERENDDEADQPHGNSVEDGWRGV
jgi:hypothetical protein